MKNKKTEAEKLKYLLEYFNELNNQLIYVMFFTLAIFSLLFYNLYSIVSMSTDLFVRNYIIALIALGIILLISTQIKKSKIEEKIKKGL